MQLGDILVITAVGNEAVAGVIEVELLDEALHGCHQVYQEISIGGLEGHHAADLAFGDDENVERVAGLGVVEGEQQVCFTETIDGDSKAHVCKQPAYYCAENGRSG